MSMYKDAGPEEAVVECEICHAPAPPEGELCQRCGFSDERRWRCCFECKHPVHLLPGSGLDIDHLHRCAALVAILLAILGNLSGAVGLSLAIAAISRFYTGWSLAYRCEDCEAESPMSALTTMEVKVRDNERLSLLLQAAFCVFLSLGATLTGEAGGDKGPTGPPDVAALRAEGASAIPDLVDALGDERASRDAQRALQEAGLAAVPWLVDALEDEDLDLRAGAARTLIHFGPDAAEGIPSLVRAMEQDPSWSAPYGDALLAAGPGAVPALAETLGRGTPAYLRKALSVLRQFGEAAGSAARPLASALSDSDRDVRREAALTLKAIGSGAREVAPELIAALQDRYPEVAVHAASALGGLGSEPGVVRALGTAALKGEERVRESAVQALRQIGPPATAAVPYLNEARDGAGTTLRGHIDATLRVIMAR